MPPAAGWLAQRLAGWLRWSLGGWLLAGWLAGWLRCLPGGWMAGWLGWLACFRCFVFCDYGALCSFKPSFLAPCVPFPCVP